MFPGGPWLIKYAPAALPFKPDSAATIKLTHYQAVPSPSPIATGESLIRYLHVGPGCGAETSQNAPAASSESPRAFAGRCRPGLEHCKLVDAALAPALPTESPPDRRRKFTVIDGGLR